MLTLDGHWVWDFWFADDGDRFHAFFLHAPTSLGDESRKHRAARIGHAISQDLTTWDVLPGPVFGTGSDDDFDATATWTGSVVRGADGRWRMFYTGSRFLGPEPLIANIEQVGVAVSDDLYTWEKVPGVITSADQRWYETWGTSGWKEEAWRDPWVFEDPSGQGWHMLTTARSNDVEHELDDRGVLGHATSPDLQSWTVQPPLTAAGAGFGHLEVPQIVCVEGEWVLLFASTVDSMTPARAADYPDAGTWAVVVDSPVGPYDVSRAVPITNADLYSGRLVQLRDGTWVFLAFVNSQPSETSLGGIIDPVPFRIVDGQPVLMIQDTARL